jgi:hypothetical protein
MVLELIMLCIKNSSTAWERHPADTFIGIVDGFFTFVIPLYLFTSVLWVLYFKSHFTFLSKARLVRMYQGGFLSLLGGAMLWTAFDVGSFKKDCDSLMLVYCDDLELRTTAGVIAILDACLYCLRPTKSEAAIVGSPIIARPQSNATDKVYAISYDLPDYEAPPSYFDLKLDDTLSEVKVPREQPSTNSAAGI